MTPTAPERPIPPRWTPIGRDVLAAAVVSLSAISSYVSGATLLFQGALRPHLALAVGAALLGGAVMSLAAAARCSFARASAGPSLSSVPVMGAMTLGIAAECPPESVMPTAVTAISLTALVIGIGWWVMGRRQWGDVARYLPYPVVGGFIASVGWLSFVGGLGVVSGQPFDVQHALPWVADHADGRLATGLAIGLVLVETMRRVRHPLMLPMALIGTWLTLLAVLRAAGLDAETARRAGWLLEPLGRTWPVWPGDPDIFGRVRWLAVAHEAGLIFSAFIVSTISLLLSETSLEHAWAERADFNRDLRAFGGANLLLGLLGGLPGELSVSRSVLNRAGGATGRGAGYLLAAICLATLVWGGPALSFLPRPLLGGLLVYQGLSVLRSWLVDARARLPWPDVATMGSMVVATALFGFLAAVCVGLLACCVSFAVASARLAPVRRLVSRSQWPSQVERAPAEVALLREAGQHDLIVELQGALFFGSANRLTRELEALLQLDRPPARLLFDFQHVRWIDSSAAQALAQLFDHARRSGVASEASRLSDEVRQALDRAGAFAGGNLPVHAHIDAAVSAWEDAVLARAGVAPQPLQRWMARAFPDAAEAAQLLAYFEPLTLAAGERLFARGDPADSMYLVEEGRMIAVIDSASGPRTVRTVSAGGFFGEMGLFRAAPRSAEVRADQASRLLRLRVDRLRAMERDRPDLAAAVFSLFVRQLADRLEQSTTQLAALV